VISLNPDASDGLVFLRKLDMQLASKMRFISAQFLALMEGDLWLRSASHGNAMAAHLRHELEHAALPGLNFARPTQVNAVFAFIDNAVADRLRETFAFYDWDRAAGEVRWMTAFDTKEADVDALVAAVAKELGASK
jgi:threonine aldolase